MLPSVDDVVQAPQLCLLIATGGAGRAASQRVSSSSNASFIGLFVRGSNKVRRRQVYPSIVFSFFPCSILQCYCFQVSTVFTAATKKSQLSKRLPMTWRLGRHLGEHCEGLPSSAHTKVCRWQSVLLFLNAWHFPFLLLHHLLDKNTHLNYQANFVSNLSECSLNWSEQRSLFSI